MVKQKSLPRESSAQGHYTSIVDVTETGTEMTVSTTGDVGLDTGWAWVIMCATFWTHIIIGGLQHTGGIVRYALQMTISEENLHLVSWLGSVYSGLISLAGPLSSFMVYKFGCRATVLIGATLETVGFVSSFFLVDEKLYFLTYSCMAGIGSGLTYTSIMVILGYNFDKYLAMASGVSVCGQGVGLLLVSILLNYFFENYGLKVSFLVMASLSLQKWVFGSLLWPSKTEIAQTNRFWRKRHSAPSIETKDEIEKESCISPIKRYLSVLQNSKFLNFLFCCMCSSAAEGMVYLMLPGYLISEGSSPNEAASVLSIIGISSLLTRPLMGFLANSGAVDIFLLFLAPIGIIGALTILLPFYVHLEFGRIMYGLCFGFYNCHVYALLNKMTVQIVGMDHLGSAFGMEMFVWGAMGILGTPMADHLAATTGSISSAFYLAGVLYIICAIAAFFLPMESKEEVIDDPA